MFNYSELKRELESLIFWIRNRDEALEQGDLIESERSLKAIYFSFEQLDSMNLSFISQNEIIIKAKSNRDYFIKDIIKDTIFVFKDGKRLYGSTLI